MKLKELKTKRKWVKQKEQKWVIEIYKKSVIK
jgi:hypothetical protein